MSKTAAGPGVASEPQEGIKDWSALEVIRLEAPKQMRRELTQRTFGSLFEDNSTVEGGDSLEGEEETAGGDEEEEVAASSLGEESESVRERRRLAQEMHLAAEYAEERSQAGVVSALLEAVREVAPQILEMRLLRREELDELRSSGWPETVVVEEAYEGMSWPASGATREEAIDLAQALEAAMRSEQARGATSIEEIKGVGEVLHVKYALRLALQFLDHVRRQPSVAHASTTMTKGRCVVVGDLHGQYRDLWRVFQGCGMPSFELPFVFNGDLVDRGPYSTEILLAVAAFAVAEPFSVYVNRGNHEDFGVCSVYTFKRELDAKYPGPEGARLHDVFEQIFAYLPTATVVDRNVLVVHGGLSDKIRDLDHLANLQRGVHKSLMTPHLKIGGPGGLSPKHKRNKNNGHVNQQYSSHDVLKDCLWSDPLPDDSETKTCVPNKTRGAGVLFPASLTTKFLKANSLGVLVRSHQCVEAGYQVQHDGKCLTLFSASNYYGDDQDHNDGAVLLLDPDRTGGGCIATYSSSSHHGDEASAVQAFEASALHRVHAALLDHRRELKAAFEARDPDFSGTVSLDDFEAVLHQVVPQMRLDWRRLAPKFACTDDGKSVNYKALGASLRTTLQRKRRQSFSLGGPAWSSRDLGDGVDDGSAQEFPPRPPVSPMASDLHEDIYRRRHEFNILFSVLDVDASGTVSKDDLLKIVQVINKLPNSRQFTTRDVNKLLAHLDKDGNGDITFSEFANTLMADDSFRHSLSISD